MKIRFIWLPIGGLNSEEEIPFLELNLHLQVEVVFFGGLVVQRQYRLNFEQLRDADGEGLGEALTEAVMQGLRQVVTNEGID